jgi:DNA (cytosine-5)-methyltransferase 1
LIKAGIPVIAGIDLDGTCKYAYESNNNSDFITGDLTDITGEKVRALYPEGCIKILVGCAPCQPFSPHTQKNKLRTEDEKWKLLYSFSRLIAEVEPTIVSMENVFEISRTQVFRDFVEKLESLGYHVSWSKVFCPDYGISQTRKRLVLLASKLGDINIIPPTHSENTYVKVKDVIGDLEPILAGEVSKKDALHRTSKFKELNLKRIRQSKPGGTWRDWDKKILSPCHKKKTGKSYSGVYARMSPDAIGPTITTQFYNYGTGRFGHPEQDRALSLREGALLQTFPPEYNFIDPKAEFSIKKIGAHIGNAVPVNLGTVIGRSIFSHFEGIL